MPETTQSPNTKLEAYEALRAGDITREEARELLGNDWEDIGKLERVESILNSQPEPDVDSNELYR